MTLLRIITIICVGFLLSGQTSEDGGLDSAFPRDTLVIAADEHACYFFDIYVATTRAQQMRGLMHVRELPEFTGMIFVYRQPGIRSMWMKNTYLPLDMLFYDSQGLVTHIQEQATPLSEDIIESGGVVAGVVELLGGEVARRDIKVGDRVVVHGHTVVAAPVVRNNRIGIDTGGCFSGNLTCLVLEGESHRFLTTANFLNPE